MTKQTTKRHEQPKCGACSHPISFHGGGETECRALGCHCETWTEPVEAPETEAVATP